MDKKFRKRLNTQIELTSLLDVIFIVLLVVICNQQINMTQKTDELEVMQQQAQVQMAEAEDLKAEAEAAKEIYEEHRDTYETIESQMSVITVYASYTPSSPQDREILIIAGEKELPKIQMSPSNTKDALERLETLLESQVSEAEDAGKPVIISINTDKILYRDEKAVSQIIDRLFEKHDNMYYKSGSRN